MTAVGRTPLFEPAPEGTVSYFRPRPTLVATPGKQNLLQDLH